MADDENTSTNGNQGGNRPKTLLDQAMDAITKAGKEAVLTRLKENRKKYQEHAKGMALLDAEAQKLVADFEAGIL